MKTWLSLIKVPLIVIGVCVFLVTLPAQCILLTTTPLYNHVKIACEAMDLAPLPPNATIVRAGGWSFWFSGRSCFVFTACDEEINGWIQNTPCLQRQTPDVLSATHRLMYFESHDEARQWERQHPHQRLERANVYHRVSEENSPGVQIHYYLLPDLIHWFRPRISEGRFYDLVDCGVFVDDANDMVWVTYSPG